MTLRASGVQMILTPTAVCEGYRRTERTGVKVDALLQYDSVVTGGVTWSRPLGRT